MNKSDTYTKLHRLIAAAVVVLIIIAAIVEGSLIAPLSSYADTTNYSNVLTDLQKDESFDMSEYPSSSTDYSLSVIQIAESEDGELFIYVYQPYTGSVYDLTATSINMSLFEWHTDLTSTGNENASYLVYTLTQISRYGVFVKYIVDGFTISSDELRYYDIASIYRTYYTEIDGEETGDNTTSELAIAVGQCWTVGEIDGETYYEMQETEVVTISSYAGFVRYSGDVYTTAFGLSTSYEYIDSHYIAFSCDYEIDELYEADISFYTQSKHVATYTYNDYDGESSYATVTYGDIDTTYYDTPLTISQGEVLYEVSYGLFGLKKSVYNWDTICTVDEFLENLEENEAISYDSDYLDTISNYQWVVRFYDTEFKTTVTGSPMSAYVYQFDSTLVTDITILRLKFLSEGQVYNLGVVSNKITGSEDPDVKIGHNGDTGCADYTSLFKQLLMIAALVLICVLFAPILPYVARFIVWVVSLPFKLINAIVQAIKKNSDKPKKE